MISKFFIIYFYKRPRKKPHSFSISVFCWFKITASHFFQWKTLACGSASSDDEWLENSTTSGISVFSSENLTKRSQSVKSAFDYFRWEYPGPLSHINIDFENLFYNRIVNWVCSPFEKICCDTRLIILLDFLLNFSDIVRSICPAKFVVGMIIEEPEMTVPQNKVKRAQHG